MVAALRGISNDRHLSDDEVIISSTEAPVSGNNHQQHCLHWPDVYQGRVDVLDTQSLVDAKQHLQMKYWMSSWLLCLCAL